MGRTNYLRLILLLFWWVYPIFINTNQKRMALNQFKDFMLVILLVASFASFAIAEYLRMLIPVALHSTHIEKRERLY